MNAIKIAAALALPTFVLTACGGESSLSDRQIADKVADHSACKDLGTYFRSGESLDDILTCDPDLDSSRATFVYCGEGTDGGTPVFFYKTADGSAADLAHGEIRVYVEDGKAGVQEAYAESVC